MKKVLVVYYSQTGQLRDIVNATVAPIQQSPDISVDIVELKPAKPFPFPWPFVRFFNTMPDTVYEDPMPIEPPAIDPDAHYDLVILAYQVWFLSPSMPTMAFLQSELAKKVLAGKPVITLIGCRNMWTVAQERVKEILTSFGARLIDNVVLTDSAHSAFTFASTPIWMVFGKKGPLLNGLIPRAGISEEDIAGSARFGRAIAAQLPNRPADATNPMLSGLGAVSIHEGLIESEKTVKRSFRLWGGFLRSLGKPSSPLRQLFVYFYFLFLLTMILTVVPLLAVVKMILKPFVRGAISDQRAYYAAPSGESRQLLDGAA
ncbi:MAG: dialkylresorcinol condensing enzyme [Caulobacterales bacterium]